MVLMYRSRDADTPLTTRRRATVACMPPRPTCSATMALQTKIAAWRLRAPASPCAQFSVPVLPAAPSARLLADGQRGHPLSLLALVTPQRRRCSVCGLLAAAAPGALPHQLCSYKLACTYYLIIADVSRYAVAAAKHPFFTRYNQNITCTCKI